MNARAARVALVGAAAFALAACNPPAPVVPATVTPTPPPQLTAGDPAKPLPDGRIEYHVVVRSDSNTVFLPLEISAVVGKGHISWVRPSGASYRFDAEADRFVPGEGTTMDEYVDAVFPASPQAVSVAVEYTGDRPAEEELHLRYRTLSIADLATKAYVPPEIADARAGSSKKERTPLGPRMRSVEVSRWLSSGFFLRDPSPVSEAVIRVAGPSR
ncbi:MAG TPA: hypothetical protein VMV18_04705 [bacterium]|nr:hypothetical protein [bacterium]